MSSFDKNDFIPMQPSLEDSSATSSSSSSSNNNNIRRLQQLQTDSSGLDAFSALEKHVQQQQPPSVKVVVEEEENILGENENESTQLQQQTKTKVNGILKKNTTSASTKKKNKKTSPNSVQFKIPSEKDTIFFQPHDNNVIENDNNDQNNKNGSDDDDDDADFDGVVLISSSESQATGLYDDDDDDDGFIVHEEDHESGMPSAVAAALDHHEIKHGTKKPSNRGGVDGGSNNSSSGDGNGGGAGGKKKNWIQKRMSQLMPKGGLVSSAANISASTLGSSALIIAYCFQRSAIVPGSLTLFVNAFFTVYTIWLLMRMLDRLGEESYEGIATRICGKKFGKSAALCVAFFGWGCAAVYAAVLKSVLAPFVPELFPMSNATDAGFVEKMSMSTKQKLFPAFVGLITQVPLALKEEMNSLRFVSTIGTFSIVVLVISVVHHALAEDSILTRQRISERVTIPTSVTEFFATMGIFVFSFCCQTNTFPVYEEMKNRSAYRMSIASILALTVCTVFYVLVGVSGLAAFGPEVSDNIVENFILDGAGSIDSVLCCISVGITVLGCFPVSLLPAREAILEAFGYDKDKTVRLGLGIFLAISALILGIISPGLVTICSVVGGAIGTWISYIFPVYLTYQHGELLDPSSPYFGKQHVIMCILVIIFGAGAGTLGSVMSVMHAIQN